MQKTNIHFSHPVTIPSFNAKAKFYLLYHAFTKIFFRKLYLSYREHFSKLGACSLNLKPTFSVQGKYFQFRSNGFQFREQAPELKIIFSKQEQIFSFGAHNSNFGSMLPKMKYFFQFRKKSFISGAGFTNSGT